MKNTKYFTFCHKYKCLFYLFLFLLFTIAVCIGLHKQAFYSGSNNTVKLKDENVLDCLDSTSYDLLGNLLLDEINFKNHNSVTVYSCDLIDVEIQECNIEKYLILGEKYDVTNWFTFKGFTIDEPLYLSNNNLVLTIDKKGTIKTLANGQATITVYIAGQTISYDFIVTDLIQKMPSEFPINKELLPSDRYNEAENDLLDEILAYRIAKAGYQTRGGVVAATRFLLLEFPYRLNYFYEYGRRTYDKVDGEGRYYLKGLYLDESRYANLIGSNTGPGTWGESIYSVMLQTYDYNGLDCSGFVTWALYNAGFDCGDIGAGFSDYYNLTDTGETVINNPSNIQKMKAGDLVHSNYMGGHIGIIAGIKDQYIYVAQATPKNNWGVTITKYNHQEFIKDWSEIVLMDNYYQSEGIYSNMWE